MNSWNALLEALHSAWIDVMTELHPEPKPLLGLPERHNAFALPNGSQLKRLVVSPILLGGEKGLALLAHERLPDSELTTIGRKLLIRAKPEFEWHELRPIVEPFELLDLKDAAELNARATIWMPMTTGKGRTWLGVTLATSS